MAVTVYNFITSNFICFHRADLVGFFFWLFRSLSVVSVMQLGNATGSCIIEMPEELLNFIFMCETVLLFLLLVCRHKKSILRGFYLEANKNFLYWSKYQFQSFMLTIKRPSSSSILELWQQVETVVVCLLFCVLCIVTVQVTSSCIYCLLPWAP